MEPNDFEKLMSEAPERADAEKIVFDEPEPEPAPEPAPEPEPAPSAVKMSVAQFGATVTGIYTAVSDFVYKRIKKTDVAPAWSEGDKEALNSAMLPVLEQYNITLTPATNLIITVAMLEAMRYSRPPMIEKGVENE